MQQTSDIALWLVLSSINPVQGNTQDRETGEVQLLGSQSAAGSGQGQLTIPRPAAVVYSWHQCMSVSTNCQWLLLCCWCVCLSVTGQACTQTDYRQTDQQRSSSHWLCREVTAEQVQFIHLYMMAYLSSAIHLCEQKQACIDCFVVFQMPSILALILG